MWLSSSYTYNICNKAIELKSDAGFTENAIHSLASIDKEGMISVLSSGYESLEEDKNSEVDLLAELNNTFNISGDGTTEPSVSNVVGEGTTVNIA